MSEWFPEKRAKWSKAHRSDLYKNKYCKRRKEKKSATGVSSKDALGWETANTAETFSPGWA